MKRHGTRPPARALVRARQIKPQNQLSLRVFCHSSRKNSCNKNQSNQELEAGNAIRHDKIPIVILVVPSPSPRFDLAARVSPLAKGCLP
jgi:hypothetical protein